MPTTLGNISIEDASDEQSDGPKRWIGRFLMDILLATARSSVPLSFPRIAMDYFGKSCSENMPRHFFWECLHLDHDSAVRADVSRQNYSVCPRYWYVDATFRCSRCSETFKFTAAEQKRWYEELGFYVDSYAKNCHACRHDERKRKLLRQEYDRDIEATLQSKDLESKKHLANVIDELYSCDADLPDKIHANRKVLGNQIARIETKNDG